MTNTPTDVVMMAAMMVPSAVPLVIAFSRGFRRERIWPVAAVLLVAVYMAVWMVFGATLFAVSGWIPAWVAVVVALAYMLTPLQRLGERGCAALCGRFSGAPGEALRASVERGVRYGLFCVACTAGVMVVVFFIGMSDVRLIVLGAGAAVLLKVRSWRAIA